MWQSQKNISLIIRLIVGHYEHNLQSQSLNQNVVGLWKALQTIVLWVSPAALFKTVLHQTCSKAAAYLYY